MATVEKKNEGTPRADIPPCCGGIKKCAEEEPAHQDPGPECCGSAGRAGASSAVGCGCGSGPIKTAFPDQGAPDVVRQTTSEMTWRDRLDHILARWGFDREGHRIRPGLYALGRPAKDSPVLVTANYTLSFDALRTALRGHDAHILVLDTFGINVWCAAGKGTFGTEEVVRRIRAARLEDVVSHRRIILPQLGAPGVSAAAVRRETGFRADFGPVRASDLPEYLRTGKATPEMRRVRFPLRDRMVLIPVELVSALVPLLLLALLRLPDILTAALAGLIAFPILLPWLPTRNYSTKGYLLGAFAAAPFAAGSLGPSLAPVSWPSVLTASAQMLLLPPITAFLALNFTGATPFPSRTGVRREIQRYIRPMAILFVLGAALYLASAAPGFMRFLGIGG